MDYKGNESKAAFSYALVRLCSVFADVSLVMQPTKSDINLPSTFFTLRQLLSRDWFAGAVLFFCGSLSLVYFSMAIFSNEEISFIDKGMGCAEQSRLCPEVIQSFFEFSASNKSWGGPIVLLIPFVLLFVPQYASCHLLIETH